MAIDLEHSGNAVDTEIVGSINASVTSVTLLDGTGWPTGAGGKFYFVIDRGKSNEEKCLATSRTGAVLSGIDRGVDGTTAASHSSGATAAHGFTATEASEANDHIMATTGHGATGAVVGTTNTQTLTNKTIGSGSKIGASGTDSSGALTAFTPTWTSTGTNPTNPNGSLVGYHTRIGDIVFFTIFLTVGSGATIPAGRFTFGGLPFTSAAGRNFAVVAFYNNGANEYEGAGRIAASSTSVGMIRFVNATWNELQPTPPSSGHTVTVTGWYQAVT